MNCDTTPPEQSDPESPGTGGECLRRRVRINNPHGFHMRPATTFARVAGEFESAVWLNKEGRRVNGKSPLELLFLAAEQGTELELEVAGNDAATAIDALARILESPTVDDLP